VVRQLKALLAVLIEAHNPQHEMLGSPRVRELVAEHAPGAKRLTARVMEELGRFTGEWWEQEDDITLVTLERLEA
jgi:serine phosphatase RsbU (regulator of sigma subunit)